MCDSVEITLVNLEQEESFETQDDSNVKSDNEKCESPTQKGGGEHSKPRRRCRRGKRRKQRKDSSAACEMETHEEHDAGESNDWKSDEDLEDPKGGGLVPSVMVRPTIVPKAPENYNTFIMDEHNECHLYKSFETPDPYANADEVGDQNCEITDPFEDAAYIDIDYEYQPQDYDYNAFYDKDFEESYKNNRYDELIRLSRNELIDGIQALERRLRDLSEELVRENPSPVLEKLQAELLELQEKHGDLRECNSKLSQLLAEVIPAPGESPANSQTLTDGFSPQSDLVSPSHTIDSKGELVLSGQSPRKGWSPYSPSHAMDSKGELILSGHSPMKGWSPYSPSHAMDSKGELVLSEQSPRKGWSPYSPIYDRRSRGETPDIEDDLVLFPKTSDVLKIDSADVNANTESVVSAKDGECCLSQPSDVKMEKSSSEDGESPNLCRQLESGFEVDQTTFKSELVHNPRRSPEEVPNSVSTLEEMNSVVV